MHVTFVGTGDAASTREPATSVLVVAEVTVLVDCGPSIPHALDRVVGLGSSDTIDVLWLTHPHADHGFGLPTLLMGLRLRGRRRPLRIVASSTTLAWARGLLDLGYPGSFTPAKCFPIEFVDSDTLYGPARGDDAHVASGPRRGPGWLGGMLTTTAPTRHKVENHAVRFEHTQGTVVVSGDGAPTEASVALWRGADLVIHECHADIPLRAGAGHADLRTLLDAARAVGLRRMALVHVDEAHRDRVESAARLAAGDQGETRLELHLPRPGATLRVTPRRDLRA